MRIRFLRRDRLEWQLDRRRLASGARPISPGSSNHGRRLLRGSDLEERGEALPLSGDGQAAEFDQLTAEGRVEEKVARELRLRRIRPRPRNR